jgi:ribosomal protein L34E
MLTRAHPPRRVCRHSYASRSNQTRKLRTPGGKLVVQYTAKKAKGPQTPAGDQGRIHGVRAPRRRRRGAEP